MAKKEAITYEKIAKLSKEDLVQLVYEQIDADDTLYRKVEKLLLKEDPKALHQALRKEIASIRRGRKFITYYDSFTFARRISDIAESIAQTVSDPKAVFTLASEMIATDAKVYDRSDDSAGVIQDAYRYVTELWRKSLHAIDEDDIFKTYMKLRICEGYGTRDLLGEEVPESVLERIYDEISQMAKQTIYEKEFDSLNDLITLQECAHFLKRPDLYRDALTLFDKEIHTHEWISLAKEYRYIEDVEGVLATLENIESVESRWANDIYKLKVWAFEKLDKPTAVIQSYHAWYRYTKDPNVLKNYLKLLPPEERESLLKKALQEAQTMPAQQALDFFHTLDKKALAAGYIMQHTKSLHTEYMYATFFNALVAWLRDQYPQAAILLYRDRIRYTLERAQSKYYPYVIKALKSAYEIEQEHDTNGWTILQHEAYVEKMLEEHQRKTKLMTLYKKAFG